MATLDIDTLLKGVNNDKNSDIVTQSKSQIKGIINDVLQRLHIKGKKLREIHKKLKDYKYVDEVCSLQPGAYLRWIDITKQDNKDMNLTTGAFLLNVRFTETGVNLVCKKYGKYMLELQLEKIVLFQRLTVQEQTILAVMDFLDKNKY